MKGTVTRLRLLSLVAVVLVVAAAIAVSAAPRRATRTEAPQSARAAAVQPAAPVAPIAHAAPIARHVPTPPVAVAPVVNAPLAQTVVQGAAGLMIYRDPETGQIGTDINAVVSPGNELNDSDEGLVEETLWDGSKMVNLQGRYQEVFVLHMGPDGKRWVECAKTPSLTSAPVAAPAPAPQFEER